MFVNVQYYFAYLKSADQKIAVSLCCSMLINKMAVYDESSLISSEVECIGLSEPAAWNPIKGIFIYSFIPITPQNSMCNLG